MASHSIAVGLVILAGLSLLYTLSVALFSPLRKVPGPVSARFTNLFYLNRVRHGRFHYENKALHRKYGPALRLGEDLVSIDDPSALKTIYGSKWLGKRLLPYVRLSQEQYYVVDRLRKTHETLPPTVSRAIVRWGQLADEAFKSALNFPRATGILLGEPLGRRTLPSSPTRT